LKSSRQDAKRSKPTNATPLPIAVRVYPEGPVRETPAPKIWRRPNEMLVFDTETRIDATQRLTFGSYRFIKGGNCLQEALFIGSDLPKPDQRIIERYAKRHRQNITSGSRQLEALPIRKFLKRFYVAAYKGHFLILAFNLPFDLSRIAHDFAAARRRFTGGFSLGIWPDTRITNEDLRNQYRPRIAIKHIDSRRALIGFTSRQSPDEVDLIPEGSLSGTPEPDYIFRGHFLDLHTLAFALTDRNYSLEAACETFGVEHAKTRVKRHGSVTGNYIAYNRRDVLATSELAVKLLEEYDKHPIGLQVTKAYSPASIGKAYLRAMGIKPILERQPNFPKKYLGHAQSAFFGGRTSAHIRKVPVPVVYTDFLSMYPTVNSLMNLWRFVIARRIEVVNHCHKQIKRFLSRLKPADLFKPKTWPDLTAFVQIIPSGDILPVRSPYSPVSNDWQVGVNYLHAAQNDSNQALWFSLPDVVASVLLTGRVPRIIDAFRIAPQGVLRRLSATRLRGVIPVDPRKQDFFKVVIEERKQLAARSDISKDERERLDKALKVLANAASYGIYAEMNRQEPDQKVDVTCHGIDPESYVCRVAHPDVPGEFCFPPLASLITGAARLMLALLEKSIRDLGGTYAMEDTDSMAIVATQIGGLVPCVGGAERMPNGQDAVRALSWRQVQRIADRFSSLNPYDRSAVPGSILKIENDNFDPANHKQRQLHCLAISAKRYALFLSGEKNNPVLLRASCPFCGRKNKRGATKCTNCGKTVDVNNDDDRWSEHGLGHLLNPTDLDSDDREWIAHAWLNMIRKTLRLRVDKLDFAHLPAVGRITVTSPARMNPLAALNHGKRYVDQIKPFNFILTCHVNPFGHPPDINPERFHLIAPYESNPRRWLRIDWLDQYSGKKFRIDTRHLHGTVDSVRVKTYGEVLQEYEFHPESKCADTKGDPSAKQTVGLLERRHVMIAQIKTIGKESTSLEDVEAGMIHSAENVYTEYPDPKRDEWHGLILPILKTISRATLIKRTGLSRTAITAIRAGRRPHAKNQELLKSLVQKLGTA
jgi:hypothetical protein